MEKYFEELQCKKKSSEVVFFSTMRDLELQGLKSLRTVPLIRIKVTNASGKEVPLTVSSKDRVAVVKDKALGGEFHKDSSCYKLVIGKCRRILDDRKSLEEEGVQEDDELVLLKRRENTQQDKNQKRVSSKAPDITTIQKLTLKLEARKKEEIPPSSSSSGFNTELRRILVSLIDSSLLLQSVDDYDSQEDNHCKGTSDAEASSSSSGDCKTDDGNSRGRINDHEIAVNPEVLKQLTDMGFSEAKATKALRKHRMLPMQAMEWLLQHESEPDHDGPEPSAESDNRTRRKRREFTPNPRALKNLKEMGFQEEDILAALKVTGNNQEAACDWLLGDKKGGVANIDEGLDPDSPMYKAIMENPMVQLGLYNPRVLSAFEDMLETPTNSGMYISDPETGPVLLQISRIVQGFAR